MYWLRHEGRGWVRAAWTADARPSPEISSAIAEASRIPGVLKHDFGVSLSPTAIGLAQVDAVITAAQALGAKWINREEPRVRTGGHVAVARPLFDYQTAGVEQIIRSGSLLLCDDMGLGKTPQAATAAATLAGGRPVVIIAPLFTREVWKNELRALELLQDDRQFCALATRDFNDLSWNPDADWYFCHYDIVEAWHSRFDTMPFNRRPAVVILDEAHLVKNPQARRSKGAYLLAATTPHRIVLTGTPIEGRPAELWALLRATTGPQTWGSKLDFRRRYASTEHDGFRWVDGDPSHVDELRLRLAPWYLRRTAVEVGLELPALTRTVYPVDIDLAATEQHAEVLVGIDMPALIRALAQGAVKDALPLITKLRTITTKAKLGATRALLDSLSEQGEHVVAFTWTRATARALNGDFTVTGEQDADDRVSIVRAFQTIANGRPVQICATYDALGVGVTLHRARIVVLHDLDWRLTTMLQAEARIHRIGQKRACQALWVVARNTIDEIIAKVLLAKAAVLRSTLGTVDADTVDTTALVAEAAGVELDQDHVDRLVSEWMEAA